MPAIDYILPYNGLYLLTVAVLAGSHVGRRDVHEPLKDQIQRGFYYNIYDPTNGGARITPECALAVDTCPKRSWAFNLCVMEAIADSEIHSLLFIQSMSAFRNYARVDCHPGHLSNRTPGVSLVLWYPH